MPQYDISVPGKGTYRVNSPTDLTDAQVWAAAQAQIASEPAPKTGLWNEVGRYADLTKLSDADRQATAKKDWASMSDAGLAILAGTAPPPKTGVVGAGQEGNPQPKSPLTTTPAIGKTVAVTQAETTPIKPADANLGSVTTGAMFAAVAGLAAGILLHWVITRHLWRNPRVSAHQTGLWCGSIIASTSLMLGIGQLVNIAVLFKLTDEDWYKFGLQWSLLLPIIYFLIGYAAGWIFRRLKPLAVQTTGASPIAPSSSPAVVNGGIVRPVTADEDEELYLQAFNELNSTDKKPGLWAMALAQTANGGNPDGAYIALRVEQLRGERSGQQQSHEQEALLLQERIKSQAATTTSHGTCPNPRCKAVIPLTSQECLNCGASFRVGSSWKINPFKA